jgi:hypothetical protein
MSIFNLQLPIYPGLGEFMPGLTAKEDLISFRRHEGVAFKELRAPTNKEGC